MSLSSIVQDQAVRERFAPLRAAVRLPAPSPLRVPPRAADCALLGTALDYLLRFEIKRRAPHAVEEEWLARLAWAGHALLLDRQPTGDQRRSVEQTLAVAEAAVARHRARRAVRRSQVAALAGHALALARLDMVLRVGRLEPPGCPSDAEAVADLVALWDAVPWDQLVRPGPVLLSPHFRRAGILGGNPDLIAGGRLIDFKVIRRNLQASELNQLIGYLLVARQERRHNPAFPAVRQVGAHLARHGVCWSVPAAAITSAPEFPAVEAWFWDHAAARFPPRAAVPLPALWPARLRPPLDSTDPRRWRRFAAAAAGRPELGPRWGWPAPDRIAAIVTTLTWRSAAGPPPRLRLCPEFSGSAFGSWASIGSPLATGTPVGPGRFQRFRWAPARQYPRPDRPPDNGTPADYPGLIDYFPQAAWDYFLKLADEPPPDAE